MTTSKPEQDPLLLRALSAVIDPDIRRPITDLGMVSGAHIDADQVAHATLHLTIAACPAAQKLETESIAALSGVDGVKEVNLSVAVMTPAERDDFVKRVRGASAERPKQFGKESLTRVIAVTSGKGGVGKSTLTANLGVALSSLGLKVGIIDADIFGFSIPGLLGLAVDGQVASPVRIDNMIVAPEAHGVRVISIGMFLGGEDQRQTAVSWRGPMLHRTIEQFLRDVWFGDLDILLLDLPPGTGDVALSVGQLLPQAEVLVITTPQRSASDVAIRSGILSLSSGQQILGVVENMGPIVLPDGSTLDMFGSGGAQEIAASLTVHPKNLSGKKVEVLGQIPLSVALRESSDTGVPVVIAAPDDPASKKIADLAQHIFGSRDSLAGKNLGLRIN